VVAIDLAGFVGRDGGGRQGHGSVEHTNFDAAVGDKV
jgi:hypothetical protein